MASYQGPGVYRHFKGNEYEALLCGAVEYSLSASEKLGRRPSMMVAYRPVDPELQRDYAERFGTDVILRHLDVFNSEGRPGVPRFEFVRRVP